MVDLRGEVIVVTGAAGGFGAAYARHLADLGAGLVLNDLDAERLEEVPRKCVDADGWSSQSPAQCPTGRWRTGWPRSQSSASADSTVWSTPPVYGRRASHGPSPRADVRSLLEVNVIGTFACGSSARVR